MGKLRQSAAAHGWLQQHSIPPCIGRSSGRSCAVLFGSSSWLQVVVQPIFRSAELNSFWNRTIIIVIASVFVRLWCLGGLRSPWAGGSGLTWSHLQSCAPPLLHLGGLLVSAHSALGFAFHRRVGSGPFAMDAQS